MLRLQEKYKKEVLPEMMKVFGYKNVMAVPKVAKVSINCGFGSTVVGKGAGDREKVEQHLAEYLSLIAGQKPSLRQAKKSIAAFKLREGLNVGLCCTLRGERMYGFLEKLVNVVLPRIRDFRGIPQTSFDKTGNLSLGFKEYTPFPEVLVEKEKGLFGLQVTVSTTAKNKEEGIFLLRMLGFPIQR